MLINPVVDMKTKCKLNYTVDDGITDPSSKTVHISNEYAFNDIDNLSIAGDTNDTLNYFQIDFIENINLKSVKYDFTAASSPIARLYYSLDGYTFYDFEFFKIEIVNESLIDANVLLALKKFDKCVFKFVSAFTQVPDGYAVKVGDTYAFYDGQGNEIITENNEIIVFTVGEVGLCINHRLMVVYNENSNTTATITNTEAKLLKNFIITEFNNFSTDKIELKYVFDYYNHHTNTTCFLYENKLIKSIRMTLEGTVKPTIMNLFEIESEKTLDVEITDLSLVNKNYFMPKYFEDNSFYPSVFSTFLDMLSGK